MLPSWGDSKGRALRADVERVAGVDERSGAKKGMAESLRRLLDQRDEERSENVSHTAVLTHDDNRHVVAVVNLSASGVMIRYQGPLGEGDQVYLQLLDHGTVSGQVRWIRDGLIGVEFDSPIEVAEIQ